MVKFETRVKSSFNLSIGTGMMLESLFEPTHERYDPARKVEKVDLKNYNYHFINMATIVRNILSAVPGNIEYGIMCKDKGLFDVFETEVRTIESLYGDTNVTPVFYFLNYDKVCEIYNHGKFKEGYKRFKTKPIINNDHIYNFLNKIDFEKNWLSMTKPKTNLTKLPVLKEKENKMLLTSHYMCDFFVPNDVTSVDSHTGRVSKKDEFYRKYMKLGNKEMSVFPFYEHLLYYVGDTSMSMTINHKVRHILYELALSGKWNQKTKFAIVRDKLIFVKELNPYYASFKPLYKIVL